MEASEKILYQEDSCKLTPREIEYLSLVALGYRNWMIAKKLFVSTSTVKKTLENIFYKLEAKDRASAVAIAFARGILTNYIVTKTNDKYN